MNSRLFRNEFLKLVSGRPGSDVRFADTVTVSCITEFPTVSANGEDGRLDILITLDNAVIGLESKFNAELVQGQAVKYLKTICQYAAKLDKAAYFAVICPKHKNKRFSKHLNANDSAGCTFLQELNWEDVNKKCIEKVLETVRQEESLETYYLLKHFKDYLDTTIGDIPAFEEQYALHIQDSLYSKRTIAFRQSILNQVYKILSSFKPGRQASGTKHIGATFEAYSEDKINESERKVWIGFVEDPSKEHKGVFLVIHAIAGKSGAKKDFTRFRNHSFIEEIAEDKRNDGWWPSLNTTRFIVNITHEWKSLEKIALDLESIATFLNHENVEMPSEVDAA